MNTLDELYASFTRYAWRLEALDSYGIPTENERMQAFLAGMPQPRSESKDEWCVLTSKAAAQSRYFSRVRMVGHPLTDYTRWEFSVYPENLTAGEDVRILDRNWLTDTNPLWNQDFWLFDDEVAVIQKYDTDGTYLGPQKAEDPRPYIELRQKALALSVPYHDYHPDPEAIRID